MRGGNARFEVAEGLHLSLGVLEFSRPWFPTVSERANLVRTQLPAWAIASGSTAGWIWTGMGCPSPWSVLRHRTPALSPLARTEWSARVVNEKTHRLLEINGLRLLNPLSTAREVQFSGTDIDASAAQILVLVGPSPFEVLGSNSAQRRSPTERARARLVAERLATLVKLYPDITR